MERKLTIYCKAFGKQYEVTEAIDGDVKWSTTLSGVAGKLTFDILKQGELNFNEGDQVVYSANGVTFFVGYVFTKSKVREQISVTCYDMLRYLQAKQSYNLENHTLTSVVKKIAGDFWLTQGVIEETGHVMEEKLYEGQGLFDIITDCITLTALATQKIFVLYDDAGKLTLRETMSLLSPNVLSPDSFARDYTYKTSIEESYNVIKLVQPNKTTGKGDAYMIEDPEKLPLWGKLQLYETVNEDLSEAKIREKAITMLSYYAQTQRSLKLSCTGVADIRAGSMVPVFIPALGDINLSKNLLVEKCTHTWGSNDHTMDLEMRVHNG